MALSVLFQLQGHNMRRILIISLLAVYSQFCFSEIYQWKDEQGNVHYGEKDPNANKVGEEKTVSAEKVEIRDKYQIPNIEVKIPLAYEKKEAHRPISFNSIKLNMPYIDSENVRIGRVTCGKPIDLYWIKGSEEVIDRDNVDPSIEVFRSLHYSVANGVGQPESMASLSLKAEVIDVKVNVCPSRERANYFNSAAYVKIRWSLVDPASGEVLYTGTSAGSHDALSGKAKENGVEVTYGIAMSNATKNLLADPQFSEKLIPIDINKIVKKFDKPIKVTYQFSSGLGTFKEKANFLKENSVIIKTKGGHGSGVVISGEGFVLTNAHVVANEVDVIVVFAGVEKKAKVVRKEAFRDVAVVQILEAPLPSSGVGVAQTYAGIGDELYVIGTPLALENSQTITKGIVSANRVMQGLRYLQTDAAINLGNSGGPVFNDKGELIALTVAGIFTKEGASVNINYLIPIQDAFAFLNIEDALGKNPFIDKVMSAIEEDGETSEADFEKPPLKRFFIFLMHWLNSPLF
jgi:serine protease Do